MFQRDRSADAGSGFISQRLIRSIHKGCVGKGCKHCRETGFKGYVNAYQVQSSDCLIKNPDLDLEKEKKSMNSSIDELVESGLITKDDADIQKSF